MMRSNHSGWHSLLKGLVVLMAMLLAPAHALSAQSPAEAASEVVVTGIVVVTDDGPVLETPDDRIFLLRGVTDTELDGQEVVVTGTAEQIEDGYFTLDVTGYSLVEEDNGQSMLQPQMSGARYGLMPRQHHI